MNVIVVSIIVLGAIGVVSAGVLYYAAQKFKVEEDSRVEEIEAVLPQANCGGCGFPGCHGFAVACVEDFEGKQFPVGGAEVMKKVAAVLGMEAAEVEERVAVVRCKGTEECREKRSHYDGAKSCAVAASLYGGETGCSFGCLGLGDCTEACQFGAIKIGADGLPEVDEEKCMGCGACVKVCPKLVIELRRKGPKGRRVFVGCVNKDKGAQTRKSCTAGCIGCMKCVKECQFEAITVADNLAYIDYTKCRLCRKCVEVCPTHAITEVNFPPKKEVKPAQEETANVESAKKEESHENI